MAPQVGDGDITTEVLEAGSPDYGVGRAGFS